ncbi:MAG TPA: hypothetical protein VNA29_01105 [Sphingomicrobium sp.]|nr:hypothetical protein [Sphingomicrobium sp.]
MSNTPLEEAMDRAERALLRIERAVDRGVMAEGSAIAHSGDEELRAKLSVVLTELDDIIREASV